MSIAVVPYVPVILKDAQAAFALQKLGLKADDLNEVEGLEDEVGLRHRFDLVAPIG